MIRKIGINADCIKTENLWENLKTVKDAGFDCFFTLTYDDQTICKVADTAKVLGLDYEFIHAPWKDINDMWTSENDPGIFFEMENCIKIAKKYGIGGVIIHASSGYHPPEVCDRGLCRYDRLVAFAKSLDIKIAFENLRKIGNLCCLIDRYEEEEHVGFCYDFGHAHCYMEKDVPWMDLFGRKTLYTHIHDNFGKTGVENEDIHVLPFEGNIDYKRIMTKLDEYEYKGSIMLEVSDVNSQYKGKDLIYEAYKRAIKLINL